MNNFIFENSTKVFFGKGCVKEYLSCWAGKFGERVLLAYGGCSMKDQHCPYLRPQKINTFIGIGSRQREFLDDLLPGDGVDSAVGYHQEQEQVKQRTAETMFIILNRCSFGKNTCQ